MKKIIAEVILTLAFVLVTTALIYKQLASANFFWDAQSFWNLGLIFCWTVVSAGYYHQGWLIKTRKSAAGLSVVLPTTVFFVQCILFVKGVYYGDPSLIIGALLVNSGVVFMLYQIIRTK